MSNLGQQLQEARSRLGYSIKEVADIIHIRPEYIGEIEENTYNIPLHTVYIRGFVRLYAKFLKLDQEEIVELYNKRNAQLEFSNEVSADREKIRKNEARSGSRSLGQFTLPGAENDEKVEGGGSRVFDRYKPSDDDARSPWIYVAGIGVAVILVFAAIFAIKLTFFPSEPLIEDGTDPNAVATQSGEGSTAASDSNVAVESLRDELIGLVAKAPVYVYVTQTSDKEILFSGRLESGERKTLIREGEIAIACDKAENLIVEKGGLPVDLKGATGKVQFLVD